VKGQEDEVYGQHNRHAYAPSALWATVQVGILTIHVRYPTTITNIDVVIERDGKGELSPMR
jgi:hypothetical protein